MARFNPDLDQGIWEPLDRDDLYSMFVPLALGAIPFLGIILWWLA